MSEITSKIPGSCLKHCLDFILTTDTGESLALDEKNWVKNLTERLKKFGLGFAYVTNPEILSGHQFLVDHGTVISCVGTAGASTRHCIVTNNGIIVFDHANSNNVGKSIHLAYPIYYSAILFTVLEPIFYMFNFYKREAGF